MQWLSDLEWVLSVPIYLLAIIVPAAIGYIFGSARSFREHAQRAYMELLPAIVRVAYNKNAGNEEEYNEALMLFWLNGSKNVALKMDRVVSILNDRKRGNVTEALQAAIVAMRRDIQPLWARRIRPDEVRHLYSRISGRPPI